MKIGLIGLGIMGKPMAKNLLKAGYDLTVNDRSQASVEDVVAAGARYATQQEIGERCDVVLTMLPNSPGERGHAGRGRRRFPYEARHGVHRYELHQPRRQPGNCVHAG